MQALSVTSSLSPFTLLSPLMVPVFAGFMEGVRRRLENSLRAAVGDSSIYEQYIPAALVPIQCYATLFFNTHRYAAGILFDGLPRCLQPPMHPLVRQLMSDVRTMEDAMYLGVLSLASMDNLASPECQRAYEQGLKNWWSAFQAEHGGTL